MPQIPIYESTEDVRQAGVNSVYASPNAFGAGIGEAMQQGARALAVIAHDMRVERKKQENLLKDEQLATHVAEGSIGLAKINAETQLTAPKDGKGTMDTALTRQRQMIEDTAALIQDDEVRTQYRNTMQGRLVPYAQSNVEFEANRAVAAQTEASNAALNSLENSIRVDGDMYDQSHKDGLNIINSQQIPEANKETMRIEWTQRSAYARFNGLLSAAQSPEEFDAIAKQLTEKKWQDAFKPNELTSVLNDIAQAKKTFITQADVTARAMLDGAEARTAKNVVIDPAEISQITEAAQQSSNPITLKRALRLQRDQQIIGRYKNLPAARLDEQANQLVGEGYPGLPPRLATAMESTARVFPGVSQSYLGNLTMQEYGVYMKRSGMKVNRAYSPRATSGKVNLKGLKPSTYDAVTLAGELFGAPLPVMSGYRSQTYQNTLRYAKGKNPFRKSIARNSRHTHGDGVDISTAGMSGEMKGKLVGALLQAGFTGFGEYDTHIHADMRTSTTRNFNPETGNLGWTQGSPAVVETMVMYGYKANVPSEALRRHKGAQYEEVDYTKGTVNGSTSAKGVHQHTDATWLEIGRDSSMAMRMGLPPNLTDAQLLALRDNPDWQFMFSAAYAEKNQTQLTKALGRPMNDAELYMAHLLGPGGAQVLISTYQSQPDAIAANLLPQAAKNNPGRFFEDGKPLSVRDVYDKVALQFSTAPTNVQFEDAETYRRMADSNRTAEKNDPMTLYSQNVSRVNELGAEGGFTTRGSMASAAADWYSIPITEMKPFTDGEAQDMIKTFSEGSVETKMELIRNINEMDLAAPGMGQAAFAQLNQKDTVFSHVGALVSEKADYAAADMIIRGNERLKNDKPFAETLFKGTEPQLAFNEFTGGALNSIPAQARNAIFDAAKAYYAESAAQKGQFEFDPDAFKEAVSRVSAGADSGLGEVNGTLTVLPDGVDEAMFNAAVDNLTDADLIAFGKDKEPPIDVAGDPVAGADVAQEGTFVYIGGNEYKIRMLDGAFLVTGERDSRGMLRNYIFVADAKTVVEVANRNPDPLDVEPELPLERVPTTGGMGGVPVIIGQ